MQVSKRKSTGFRRSAWHFFSYFKGLWLFATMKTTISAQYYWRHFEKRMYNECVLHVNMSERSVKILHATCNWTLFAILFQKIVCFSSRKRSRENISIRFKRQWKIEKHSNWICKQKMSTRMWSCCLSSMLVLHMKIEEKRSSEKYGIMLWNILFASSKITKMIELSELCEDGTLHHRSKYEVKWIINFCM